MGPSPVRVGQVLTAGGCRVSLHLEAEAVILTVVAGAGSVQGAVVLDFDQAQALSELLAEASVIRAT